MEKSCQPLYYRESRYNHIKILCLQRNVLLPGIMMKIAKIEVEDRNIEGRLKKAGFSASQMS
jgi:hypothetical protein